MCPPTSPPYRCGTWSPIGQFFDIEARADGNPTKDDMRLMMQSLLVERFHMVLHRETREEPVFSVAEVKPGKTGPQLKQHSADDPTCAKTTLARTFAGSYPAGCGAASQVAPKITGDFAVAGTQPRWIRLQPRLAAWRTSPTAA